MANRAVALGDSALVVGVAVAFQALGPASAHLSVGQGLVVGVTGATGLVALLTAWGGYRPERRRRFGSAMFDIVLGVAAAAGVDRVLVWTFTPAVLHANAWLAAWTGAVIAVLGSARLAVIGLARRPGPWLRRRVAVVGEGPECETLAHALRSDDSYQALGAFTPATLPALRCLAEQEGVDLIVLATSWKGRHSPLILATELQGISADLVALVDEGQGPMGSRAMTQVAGRPALLLNRHPLKGAEGAVKLAQDYVVAGVALFVAAPIMAAVAVAIRVVDGGPVLFRQQRLGFNGRLFTIYKFRTMRVDPADDGTLQATRHDARCSRLGAFLRRTSLDELPQLFNVLRGEMSVVGPRPHIANMRIGDVAYAEGVRAYTARHQIKPGLTGWAQINGMRGGISTLDKARAGVDLDLDYIRHWSLWLDLRIILATLFVHLTGAGAC